MRTIVRLLSTLLFCAAAIFAQGSGTGLSTIYSFPGGHNGASPMTGVALGRDAAGKPILYGATLYGGEDERPCPEGCGVAYSLTPGDSTDGIWNERVLFRFNTSEGWLPASVVAGNGPDGQPVLYGSTWYGGPAGYPGFGTVFSLTPPASGGGVWTQDVLYDFNNGDDGEFPYGGVVLGSGPTGEPILYFTTYQGGSLGKGAVLSLTPTSGGGWSQTVLYSFDGGTDGENPQAGVVIGPGGVLYGTTTAGGTAGDGTVFALNPPASAGGAWTETIRHNFSGSDGWYPWAGVTIGSGPGGGLVLYGTTYYGGTNTSANCMFYRGYVGCGTVYSLTAPATAGGAWTERVLYSFNGGADGALLYAGVTPGKGPDGSVVLYGATGNGGSGPPYSGAGVVFSLTPPSASGGAWTETVLHTFTGGSDGYGPEGNLVIGEGGMLYGTTNQGGVYGYGTVFRLKF